MTTQLTKHEEHYVVELKNGTTHYILSERIDQFYTDLNDKKFIRIGNAIVNTYEVLRVYPDLRKTADVLKQYNQDIIISVKNRAKEYKANLNKNPTGKQMLKWAEEFSKY